MKHNDDDFLEAFKSAIDNNIFKDMTSALKTNGKSKLIEDFNILDEYHSRFQETPSILKFTHDDCDFFSYEKLKKTLTEQFKSSKILFSDTEFNLKRNKFITTREVWYIDEGYLLNLWTSESKNIYANPETDIKMNRHEQLIEENSLLVPPQGSKNQDDSVINRIIGSFKVNTIKEYERNSIGMISVGAAGELYVKDFSIDKKFKIEDLDLHYGEEFKNFHNELYKKLKSDKKGLILLHGEPGTGKCVHGKTFVTIRNKKTQKIENVNIEDLFQFE